MLAKQPHQTEARFADSLCINREFLEKAGTKTVED
jgi:hypothetical protein